MFKTIIEHLNENINKKRLNEVKITKITPETIYKEVKTYVNIDFYLNSDNDSDRLYASNRLYEVELNKKIEDTCLSYEVDESYIYSDLDIPGESNVFTLSYMFYQTDISQKELSEFESNLKEDLQDIENIVKNIIPDLDFEFDKVDIESETKIDYTKTECLENEIPDITDLGEDFNKNNPDDFNAYFEDRPDLEAEFDSLWYSVDNEIEISGDDLNNPYVEETNEKEVSIVDRNNDFIDVGHSDVTSYGKVISYYYEIEWNLKDILKYLNKSLNELTKEDLDLIDVENFESYLKDEYRDKAISSAEDLINKKEFDSLHIDWSDEYKPEPDYEDYD